MDQIFDFLLGLVGVLFFVGPILAAFILCLVAIWMGGRGRKTEKEMSPEEKRKYVAEWIGKKETACTQCNEVVDSTEMTIFQKYERFGGDHTKPFWKEVIPGRGRPSLADKLPEVKFLCPRCAPSFRHEVAVRRGTSIVYWCLFLALFVFGVCISVLRSCR